VSDVVMPRLSDSMEEGTILKWLKASGDEVKRGEEIVEIETDKANMTYEADASGVLSIVADEGSTLPIGELIAHIGDARSAAPPAARRADPVADGSASAPEAAEASPVTPPARSAAPAAVAPAAPAAPAAAPEANGRVKASPLARRLAKELGVDLGSLQGTGPGGRIVKADVEAGAKAGPAPAGTPAPAAPVPVPGPVGSGAGGSGKGAAQTVALSKLQQTIARRMAESKATIPEFTVSTEVDMAAAVALRAQLKVIASDEHPAPSFNDMVVKACALALREFPRANGSYKDGNFELYERVNVGVAVAAQDALIVPTVFDADRKSLGEIGVEARSLAARVRGGQITPPELSGGTFTVSNLGMFGVTDFTAIINAGQAGILAVGGLLDTPIVENGQIVAGKRMALTLTCDHRILYGTDAAQFLARIRALLEAPLALAL
jgi:pyruvate dehydrogenase E2 component (dihydrolipoamide acetyltransferase)